MRIHSREEVRDNFDSTSRFLADTELFNIKSTASDEELLDRLRSRIKVLFKSKLYLNLKLKRIL